MSTPPGPAAPWSLEPTQLLAALGSRPEGLAAGEAARRAAAQRPRALAGGALPAWPRLLLAQFASPLVLILVFAAALSLLLRDWVEAAIVLAIVGGSALLGFVQEWRAGTAVARLRSRLALQAQVRRDGRVQRVPASEVVAGDVVLLAAGALVPADAVLLQARDFLVSEAALTGESLPVEKHPGPVPAGAALAARTNCVFLGTSVRSGSAEALVTATGRDTVFGAVAERIAARAPETEFARGVRRFGELLLRVMVVMVLGVVLVHQALGRPLAESLLFAVALAVGLSPELLPAIVSVTVARGARAMARRGVLVRRLEAIENLGSIDVLATDKTGTLTTGTVELAATLDATGAPSEAVARLAWANAALETGIDNPLDAALVQAGRRAGFDDAGWTKVDEIPYDFQRRRLTIVAVPPQASADEALMITKGAFDHVLAVCTHWRDPGGAVGMPGAPGAAGVASTAGAAGSAGTERALDAAARERFAALYRAQGEAGQRVLALATRRLPGRPRVDVADEAGLVFEGFLLFADPPKAQAAQTLRDLSALGIRVTMITGDNRHVAAHVAGALGLSPQRLLTGTQLAAMGDEALWHAAPRTDVFAEVDPQQKERIVRALQRTGHAVGYMGDGINDAPALRAADVGISVDRAVDVARESADVVLLRPDLEVLKAGIEDGRRCFANTLKYIGITTSANFGNMLSMALGSLFLPFLPLAAKQILLNNFLSDLPSIAISTDRVDAERVATPQRWRMDEVRRFMIVFGLVSTAFDLLTFALLRLAFGADEPLFQTAWFVVSLLTELAVVLVLRTRGALWRSRPSPLLLAATLLVAVAALALPWLPGAAALFGFVAMPPALVAALLAVVLAYLAVTEQVKRRIGAA